MTMIRAGNAALLALLLAACGDAKTPRSYVPPVADNPATTNDESNDKPLGSAGTLSLCASTPNNGRSYTLDADVEDGVVSTVYFPKGGNVDFDGCELDDDLTGECEDEHGKTWEFNGEC